MLSQLISLAPLVLSGYLAGSLFLFAFPTLLHPPHPQPPLFQQALKRQRVLIIGHRGGTRQAVENTTAAFDLSLPVTDMLEMDICLTRDGVLLVHHDGSLSRTCGVDRNIGDCDIKDIPAFQEQIEVDFSEELEQVRWRGESIPTLEEVFSRYPQVAMNIEIKTPSLAAIAELQRLVLKHNRVELTIIGIKGGMGNQLAQKFPQSNRFFSYGTLPRLLLLYFSGLLPFVEVRESALQIPLYTRGFEAMRTRLLGDSLGNRLFFLLVRMSNWVLRPLIWHLRRRGVMTFYWVCNQEEEFERALACGGCGIMTDDAVYLHAFLNKRG